MKPIFLLSILLLISSCKGSGSSDVVTPVAVVGYDMTGTYIFSGIECYSPSFALTAATTFTAGSAVATWTINGNSTVSKSVSGACAVTTTFQSQFIESATATGTINYKNRLYTTNTGGTCSQTETFATSGFSVTSLTASVMNNTSLPDSAGSYLRSITNGNFVILSTIQDTGHPTSSCYLVYSKQ